MICIPMRCYAADSANNEAVDNHTNFVLKEHPQRAHKIVSYQRGYLFPQRSSVTGNRFCPSVHWWLISSTSAQDKTCASSLNNRTVDCYQRHISRKRVGMICLRLFQFGRQNGWCSPNDLANDKSGNDLRVHAQAAFVRMRVTLQVYVVFCGCGQCNFSTHFARQLGGD